MSRDKGYYWSRIVIYIIVAFAVGTLFYDVGTSYTAILARGACGGFVTGYMTFMSIGGFPSFIEEMKVYIYDPNFQLKITLSDRQVQDRTAIFECFCGEFWNILDWYYISFLQVFTKERLNGHYGVAAFVLANFLSSFPFLVAVSLITGTITYYMVFRARFFRYVFFCLNLFGCIAVVESCMMIVASLVPNFLMGIITGAGVLVSYNCLAHFSSHLILSTTLVK